MPAKLQGEVRFDGDTQIGGALGIIVPTPFAHLLGKNVPGGLPDSLLAFAAEEAHQQDVLGLENRVPLKFADPVAVWSLLKEQMAPGALKSNLKGG